MVEFLLQLCSFLYPYTLEVFVDLSKAFGTTNHSVLNKKFQMFDIIGINLAWFRSYLANRKQYILLGHDLKTGNQNILYGIPQALIPRPLPFLLYAIDVPNSSEIDPIMLPDDTNLVFEHTDLSTLFFIVNECHRTHKWFNANKFSLNADKTMEV